MKDETSFLPATMSKQGGGMKSKLHPFAFIVGLSSLILHPSSFECACSPSHI